MDVITLLFTLILLSAGIWLIYNVSGDFKEKSRQGQKFADVPHRRHQVSGRNAAVTRNSLEKMPRPSVSKAKIGAPKASPVILETMRTADPLQSFSEAFVREKFESFEREL